MIKVGKTSHRALWVSLTCNLETLRLLMALHKHKKRTGKGANFREILNESLHQLAQSYNVKDDSKRLKFFE